TLSKIVDALDRIRVVDARPLSSCSGTEAAHNRACGRNCNKDCTMPTVEDYFPKFESKFFRVADVTKEMALTIKSVTPGKFVNDNGVAETKPVVAFNEVPKSLVANKTNFVALSTMLGDDSNTWVGAKIGLCPAKTEFRGRMVDTIRVKRPSEKAPSVRGTSMADAADRSRHGAPFDDSADIRF